MPKISPALKNALLASAGLILFLIFCHFIYEEYAYVSTDNANIQAATTLLSARVSGTIVRAEVQENQKVRAGQLLAEIKPDDYINYVEQAAADMESLAAELKAAQLNFKRTLDLFHKGAISRERLDSSEAQFKSLDQQLKSAQAQVAQAKLNLSYTQITAPSDGQVGRKSFEVGMMATPGQPLLGFVAGKDRWVVANFKETDLDSIAIGRAAFVTVDAVGGKEFKGTVESISPTTGSTFSLLPPDNATGNFTKVVQRVPVRIKLTELSDAEVDRLQAGLSVEVKIRVH